MITKYVDMSLSGSSGTGTTGDPYSFLACKSYFEIEGNWTDDHTFKFRNRGFVFTDNEPLLNTSTFSAGIPNHHVILESDTNEPAVLKFENNYGYPFDLYGSGSLTIRNLIIEGKFSGDSFTGLAYYDNTDSSPLVFQNCVYCVENTKVDPSAGQIQMMESYGDADIIGNHFKYIGNNGTSETQCVQFIGQSADLKDILISSNYVDGKFSDFIAIRSQGHDNIFNGIIRKNAIYNDAPFSSFLNIIDGTQSGLSIVDNFDSHLLSSEFSNYNGTWDGDHVDITPQVGSALIDAGYAESGWNTDLFGQARDASPDIGAVEYIGDQPVTCWNYSARYKGSSRLYRVNGGGKYPSTLQVPGNVDISTGRMIDEGELIDPNEFKIIQ